MNKIIYRIRLINGQKPIWKNYHNDAQRLINKRKELWKKHARVMEISSNNKSDIEPLFQQMEIDERQYFEIQSSPESIDINALLPDMDYKA